MRRTFKSPLRRIVRRTAVQHVVRRVPILRSGGGGIQYQHHRIRVWHVWLECGHDFQMPFAKRKIKARMRCLVCGLEAELARRKAEAA